MSDLIRIREPRLEFALGQTVEDPGDGLALFGPYDANVYGVRAGVIGTKEGIRRFNKWVESISKTSEDRIRGAISPAVSGL